MNLHLHHTPQDPSEGSSPMVGHLHLLHFSTGPKAISREHLRYSQVSLALKRLNRPSRANNQPILLLSIAQFLIHPKAPPRRIVSGCSVYITIFDKRGSSESAGVFVDGCGNGA
jgi:hypothetical protein